MLSKETKNKRKAERVLHNGRWVAPTNKHGTTYGYDSLYCRCEPCTNAIRQKNTKRRRDLRSQRIEIDGRLIAPVPTEMHGKPATYANHSCRCEACTIAYKENYDAPRKIRYRAEREVVNGRLVAVKLPPEKHGKYSTYSHHGCRCSPCIRASKMAPTRWARRKAQ
jgi:hypothetical protein